MITRRNFVFGTTILSASAPLSINNALASLVCTPFNNQGVQECTAGLQLGSVQTESQKCMNWCWAACIQTIFRIYHYNVSQQAIVHKLFSSNLCLPASGPQIIAAINGQWSSDNGTMFYAQAQPLMDLHFGVFHPQTADIIVQELVNGYPLINGALGHATLLTAMTYLSDFHKRIMPRQFIVRDPWPYNTNRRILTQQEVQGTNLVVRVRVS